MNDYNLESFIDYCDNMKITNEGFLESIKNGIKKALLTILNALKKLFSKGKDNKIKSKIRELIDKARRALGEVDEIETQEDANELKDKTEEIKKETEKVQEEIEGKIKKYKKYSDGSEFWYDDLGRVIKYKSKNGWISETEYYGNTDTAKHKKYSDGSEIWYDEQGRELKRK